MKFSFNKIMSTSLIIATVFSFVPYVNQNLETYAISNNYSVRDIDDGAELVDVGRLTHRQVDKILSNWDDFNTALGLLKDVFPPAMALEFLSNVSQYSLARADRGNGVIVKQLQYPNGCTFCGGSGGFVFFSR